MTPVGVMRSDKAVIASHDTAVALVLGITAGTA
jgi:hypothetical protein